MLLTLIAAGTAGWIGWRRAERRGGALVDRMQYAFAHAVPVALLTLLAVTIAARMLG